MRRGHHPARLVPLAAGAPLTDPQQQRRARLAYYLCAAPAAATEEDLIRVAGSRWGIEECFQTAKNETGLDHYQVRRYDAWYRHTTLAMLAHAYLAVTAAIAPKALAAASRLGASAFAITLRSLSSPGRPLRGRSGTFARRAMSSRPKPPSAVLYIRRPAASSQSTIPAANTSARASMGSPRACSGLMYPALPLRASPSSCAGEPAWAAPSRSLARAIPKSQTFTSPSNETSRFDGDTSRWTIPSGLALVVGAAMGVVEPLERLAHDVDAELEGQRHLRARAAAQQIVEVETLDVLHRDEESLVLATQVEHLDDVRVAEARRELRLVHEHVAERRVARELRQDLLDDAAPRGAELGLLTRQVDLRHPALSDEIEQRVATEETREKDVGGGRHDGGLTSPSPGRRVRSSRRADASVCDAAHGCGRRRADDERILGRS